MPTAVSSAGRNRAGIENRNRVRWRNGMNAIGIDAGGNDPAGYDSDSVVRTMCIDAWCKCAIGTDWPFSAYRHITAARCVNTAAVIAECRDRSVVRNRDCAAGYDSYSIGIGSLGHDYDPTALSMAD